MDRVHCGLCPRVSAFARFPRGSRRPWCHVQNGKRLQSYYENKKVQKKNEGAFGPQAKRAGGRGPRPGLYTFSRLSGIREHTRLAREARVFADADKLFMVTLSGGLLLFFCGGGQSERGSAIIGASKGPWAHHTHGAGLFVRVHRSEHLRKPPTTPRRGTCSGSRASARRSPRG